MVKYYHPGYDALHRSNPIEDIYGTENCPIDGYLVSKAFENRYLSFWGGDPKKGRKHYNEYNLKVFGDSGAFSFINEPVPPVSVVEVIEFYNEIDVDEGASLDHIVPDYDPNYDYFFGGLSEPTDFRDRLNITIQNGRDFFSECVTQGVKFLPIGSLQGWSPKSYLECLKAFQTMGYKKVALGGVAKLSPQKVIEILLNLKPHLGSTELHLFGITQANVLRSVKIPQITSVDGMGPFFNSLYNYGDSYRLEGTWHQVFPMGYSKPPTDTTYDLIRPLMENSREDSVKEIDLVLKDLERYRPKLLRSLRRRVWEDCGCKMCSDLGWEIMLYDSQINFGRAFHNMWQVSRELKEAQSEVLKSSLY